MGSFFTFTELAEEARAQARGEPLPHVELRVRRHERGHYGVQGPHEHEIGPYHWTAQEAVRAIRTFFAHRRETVTIHVYGPDMRYFRRIDVGGGRC